ICADVFVHLRFVSVPAPRTILVDCNIGEGIEIERSKSSMPRAISPVGAISVPQMENSAIQTCYFALHGIVKRPGPGQIVALLHRGHMLTLENRFEATVNRVGQCATAAANDASVEEAMPIEKLAAGSPRSAGRQTNRGLIPETRRR